MLMQFTIGMLLHMVMDCVVCPGSRQGKSSTNVHQWRCNEDDYAKALRIIQTNLVEIKIPQRDEAAAFDDDHKYY